MNFLFPTFLIGLTAIAIPIIIHLFNFRKYKTVYFTNVQFLKELKQESDSKSKLKEWLILAMRILAIASLVFAFAQPYIASKTNTVQGSSAISVFIDNSFSMENNNKQGTLLENAKQRAAEIAKAYNDIDKFQLLTNDFEGKHQRFLSKEDFLEQVNEVKISSATKSINDVVKRQQDFLLNAHSNNKQIFIISDFQKNASSLSKQDLDSNVVITFIPIVSSEVNNVYIDSVWFENPIQQFGTQQTIHATIVNNSDKDIENGSLKLYINNAQASLTSFNISAESKAKVNISFPVKVNGINKGRLKIEDYPITYDDDFYFSFNAQTTINALVINGNESKTASNFRSLLQNDSLFIYKENNEASINYGEFSKVNIIILNELITLSSGLTSELQKFIQLGGSLVIFPSKMAVLASYNIAFQSLQLPTIIRLDTAQLKVQSIDFEQGLYEGVFEKTNQHMDLPKVFHHFELTKNTNSNLQNIALLQNGQFFMSLHQSGVGKIYLFSTPSDLSSSNFLKHALFVPTILKMSILSLKPSPIYYYTAINEAISLNVNSNFSDKPLHIVKDDQKLDVIPEHRLIDNATHLYTQNQITEAGYYAIMEDATVLKDLAFNFERKESDMNFMTEEDIQAHLIEIGLKNITLISPSEKSLTNTLQEMHEGKKLWKLFLILALVFLAAEILIIRLLK